MHFFINIINLINSINAFFISVLSRLHLNGQTILTVKNVYGEPGRKAGPNNNDMVFHCIDAQISLFVKSILN